MNTKRLITSLILMAALPVLAQTWPWTSAGKRSRTLYVATTDKTIFNSATEASMIPTSGVGTTNLYADYITAGQQFDIEASGMIAGLTNNAANTTTIQLKIGKYTIATTGAIAIPMMTSNHFQFKGSIVFRTVGAAGTAVGTGLLTLTDKQNTPTNSLAFPLGYVNVTSPAITIGTTTNTYIDLTATRIGAGAVAWTNQLRTDILRISTTE